MHVNFAFLHTFIIGVVSFATVVWSRHATDVLSLPHRVGWEKSAHYETKKPTAKETSTGDEFHYPSLKVGYLVTE